MTLSTQAKFNQAILRQTNNKHGLLNADELKGRINLVRHSADNGWCCLDIIDANNSTVRVTGICPGAKQGEQIHCYGDWINHPRFGRQFEATSIIVSVSANSETMEKYLASGAIDGIGKHYAQKLARTFGKKLFDVLDNNPTAIERVNGIGPQRRKRIAASWEKQKSVRDIMLFLSQSNISQYLAQRIYTKYGDQSINVLRGNPYRLNADLTGIGFNTADKIAKQIGFKKDDSKRILAGLRNVLYEARIKGHCAVKQAQLVKLTQQLLNIPETAIELQLERSIRKKHLVAETLDSECYIYSPKLYKAETSVARQIKRLNNGCLPWKTINTTNSILHAEQSTGIRLSDSQRKALTTLLLNKVSIVTGSPGSGKTTLTKLLLTILQTRTQAIALCAPTGRAARRLSEATGIEATTIHRLLLGGPGTKRFCHHQDNPLKIDVLIVDECSMVDIDLMQSLLEAILDQCVVIFIGDADQLPSVGPGNVLADLIQSGVIPVARLTEIHRQASHSSIILNAQRIKQGQLPLITDNDFYFITENEVEKIPGKIEETICKTLPAKFGLDPSQDIQVLTPMHKGELGTYALNRLLQSRINPHATNKIVFDNQCFAVGDRVIQKSNNHEKDVYNGDIGTIKRIESNRKKLLIEYNHQTVWYKFNELKEISLAFAITIHKSQGSEYPAIVMPICMAHYILLNRSLLITATTRSKSKVFLIGQQRALHNAIRNQASFERVTGLKNRLARLI